MRRFSRKWLVAPLSLLAPTEFTALSYRKRSDLSRRPARTCLGSFSIKLIVGRPDRTLTRAATLLSAMIARRPQCRRGGGTRTSRSSGSMKPSDMRGSARGPDKARSMPDVVSRSKFCAPSSRPCLAAVGRSHDFLAGPDPDGIVDDVDRDVAGSDL